MLSLLFMHLSIFCHISFQQSFSVLYDLTSNTTDKQRKDKIYDCGKEKEFKEK
jgi:hypothetical protein